MNKAKVTGLAVLVNNWTRCISK